MMKKVALAVVLAFGAMTVPALAQAPAATQAGALSADSSVAQLRANPAAWAIIERELPQVAASPQVPPEMTLTQMAQYAPQMVTPEKIATINAALAALPH